MLVDQAVTHLAAFGPEADVLRDLAGYVVARDH
jgi:farnesyl diphosphate synthase